MPWLFRSAFHYDSKRAAEVMTLTEREAITDMRLLVQSLAVLALVVAAFVLHPVLHFEPSIVALLGAGLLVATTRVTTQQAIEGVEWPTLVFFAGLFTMVGGLVETGVIGNISQAAAEATAIGASANVVVLGIAARDGAPISFWTFTRYGLLAYTTSSNSPVRRDDTDAIAL